MPRSIRSLLAALCALVALGGVAACGIDADEVGSGEVAAGSSTTTEPSSTTTEPAGPEISLPDIPSDVTEPEDTVPDPTDTTDTIPSGQETPGGFTPENIRDALVADADLTEEQATCVSIGVFATMDGPTIDELFTAETTDEVDPQVLSDFEDIVLTCVQGG